MPRNGPISRTNFGQADAAAALGCARPCASDQCHDARRDGSLGPRSGGAPFTRPATLARTHRLSLGSPPCARQTTTAPWPQRILGTVKPGAYAGKQSRITSWPNRGWPRCLRYGHDENILPPARNERSGRNRDRVVAYRKVRLIASSTPAFGQTTWMRSRLWTTIPTAS